MDNKFKPTDGSRELWPVFSKQMTDAAFAAADDFAATGLGPREACSVVAHAMIRAAYGVAAAGAVAAGAVAAGKTPDKNLFREAVEDALSQFPNKSDREWKERAGQ